MIFLTENKGIIKFKFINNDELSKSKTRKTVFNKKGFYMY